MRDARSSMINQAKLTLEQEPLDHNKVRNPAEQGERRVELLKWDTQCEESAEVDSKGDCR